MEGLTLRLTTIAWLMAAGTLTSCGDGSSAGEATPAVTVTDSGGIEIVYSPTPAWTEGDGWMISDTPTAAIGEAGGDDAYTLFRVRAAVRLVDGRIAVANSGTAQVRIYDGAGQHLQDIGGEGDGPGEFRLLMDLWPLDGDSIMAADNRLGRLTVFDTEGRLGRTVEVLPTGEARQGFVRGPFDDGGLLVSVPVPSSEMPRAGVFDGGTREFHRYSEDGTHRNRIGQLPHGLNWGYEGDRGLAYTSAPFSIFSPPHASDGVHVYLGDGSAAQVEQRNADGELLRIVRWGVEASPVTSDVQARYAEAELEAAGDEFLQMTRAKLDGIVFPETLPVYDALLVDEEDHLWVRAYRVDPKAPARWWVFDDSGRWLGEAPIPPGLEVMEVGRDHILGVRRDENDVERVMMHALDRGP